MWLLRLITFYHFGIGLGIPSRVVPGLQQHEFAADSDAAHGDLRARAVQQLDREEHAVAAVAEVSELGGFARRVPGICTQVGHLTGLSDDAPVVQVAPGSGGAKTPV